MKVIQHCNTISTLYILNCAMEHFYRTASPSLHMIRIPQMCRVQGHVTSKFRQITDNVVETVQNRDTDTMECPSSV